MKLEFTFRRGDENHASQIELKSLPSWRETNGRLEVQTQDGQCEADWAEVTPRVYSILLNGRSYDVRIENHAAEETSGGISTTHVGSRVYRLELRDPRRARRAGAAGAQDGPQEIRAPMPGKIVKVLVAAGQEVKAGDSLIVIEAMKMQNEIHAPRSGRVEEIRVAEGAGVESGTSLLRMV